MTNNTMELIMDEFIEDYNIFDGLCHRRGMNTAEAISLYACFLADEAKHGDNL